MSLSRRRLLINNGDGTTSTAYGGTLVLTERPTEPVSFDCPGCTRFAILYITRDMKSGNYGALFTTFTSVKDGGTDVIGTYPTGVGGYTAHGYTEKQYAGKFPMASFTDVGVTMEVADYTDTEYRWFGAGTYEWVAW